MVSKSQKMIIKSGYSKAVMFVLITAAVFTPARVSALELNSGWSLVAMPCSMSAMELVSKSGAKDLAIYGWDGENYYKAEKLERGKAYLVRSGRAVSVGGICASAASSYGTYIPKMRSGWNLVGNPYDSPYSMTEILSGAHPEGVEQILALPGGVFRSKRVNEKLARWEGAFVYYHGSFGDGSNCVSMCESDAGCAGYGAEALCLNPGTCSAACEASVTIATGTVAPSASEDVKVVSNGVSQFAADIYKAVKDVDGENMVFSPYSLAMLLSMLYSGAANNTEKQIADVLHSYLPVDRHQQALHDLNDMLQPKDGGFDLTVANGAWAQKGYTFKDSFMTGIANYYGADAQTLDFMNLPDEARSAINSWVNEKTDGMITEVIADKVIDSTWRLALVNAVYFKAGWTYKFEPERTYSGQFRKLDGTTADVDMMTFGEYYKGGDLHDLYYYSNYSDYGRDPNTSDVNFKALELPYLGGNMAMVVLLPQKGSFKEFEAILDAKYLDTILENMRYKTEVEVSIPKFKMEYSFADLKEVLSTLGMPDAFIDGTADFSRMDGTKFLSVGFIDQKAVIEVNETGTVAAAASSSGVVNYSAPPKFVADSPFIYIIRDKVSGAILFWGRVTNPKY